MTFQNKNHVIPAKPHCMAAPANFAIFIPDSKRLRGNDSRVGRGDDNEGFAGWALPTVFPVFMRLSWRAKPTLLNTCGNDA